MAENIVAFLGTGSMNGSIAAGLIASGFDPARVRATVRSEDSAGSLREKLSDTDEKVQIFTAESDDQANARAVDGADVVLLGVKPYDVLDLAREIAPALSEDTLVISVAAGVPLDALQKALGEKQPAVRCMPNTPSRVGHGVMAISAGQTVSEDQLKLAHEILGAVGEVFEVAEDQMDAVTAVSGSGPAYAFLLAETMSKAGQKLGLDADLAAKLAAATVGGAGALLEEDPNPEDLRKAVTSPGGTTEQAILSYQDSGLEEITYKAMKACADKSQEMSREYTA